MMQPANDRQEQGLRGPVRNVSKEWHAEGRQIEELSFDPEGNLTLFRLRQPDSGLDSVQRMSRERPTRLQDRGITHADGSMTKIQDLSGMNTWSMDGLHQWCFATWGATLARTEFDHRGVPVETIFEDDQNQQLFRIDYLCDTVGRIREAVQSAGATPPSWALALMSSVDRAGGEREGPVEETDAGGELFRFLFRYDEAGRIVAQESQLRGQRVHHRVMTHNEQGDLSTLEEDGKSIRFEYEYDDRGNWIERAIYYSPPASPVRCRRTIHYYGE